MNPTPGKTLLWVAAGAFVGGHFGRGVGAALGAAAGYAVGSGLARQMVARYRDGGLVHQAHVGPSVPRQTPPIVWNDHPDRLPPDVAWPLQNNGLGAFEAMVEGERY